MTIIFNFAFFIVAVICLQWVSGAKVHIDVDPSSNVVSCLPSDNVAIKQVQTLKLTRNNGELLATARRGAADSVFTSPDRSYRSMTHLDPRDNSKSYVRVIFSSPGKDDAGVYKCTTSYLDWYGVQQQETVKKTITWDKSDDSKSKSKSKEKKNTPFVGVSSDSSTRIKISPSSFVPDLTKEVQVSCRPEIIVGIQKILLLSLTRSNGDVLAMVGEGSNAKSPRGKINVESHVDNVISKSFIKATIHYPSDADSGVYICKMVYISQQSQVKQGYVEGTLTTSNINASKLASLVVSSFDRIYSQEAKIKNVKNKILALTNRFKDLAHKHEGQSSRLSSLESGLAYLKDKENTPVAFSLYTEQKEVTKEVALSYDSVKMNLGGAYNKNSSDFTAPTDGLYEFRLFAFTQPPCYVILELTLNGNTEESKSLGRLVANTNGWLMTMSNVILVKLKAQDKVDTRPVAWENRWKVRVIVSGRRISKL